MSNIKRTYEEIIELYQDGMTEKQIAKKLGVDLKLVEAAIEFYTDYKE
jgi:uncharacterized protein (DUF433 family)